MASTLVRFGGEGLDSSSILLGRFVDFCVALSVDFFLPTRSSVFISSKSRKFDVSKCAGDRLF